MRFWISALLSVHCLSLFAQAPTVTLLSRNKPVSCQYVFAVDSDLFFEIQNPNMPVSALELSYKDEYTGKWTKPEEVAAFKNPTKANSYFVAISFRSMSTNPKFLLRQVAFKISPDFAVTPKTIHSEFGRQFGEKCFDSPDETPYLPRELKISP